MNIFMLGKGLATVVGFILLAVSGHVDGTPFADWGPALEEIGKAIGEFGLLRKGVVDYDLFGKRNG